MNLIAKAKNVNPIAVTKALAEHVARVEAGWNHAESMVVRDNRLRAIAARIA